MRGTALLVAGGTGGHLFPAFALAEELQHRGWTVDLVTDERGDRYGTGFPAREIHQVPAATLRSRSPADVAATALKLGKGVFKARALLARVRPRVVIGFGGYPTFPPLVAAWLGGIPTVIHEQNAVMGRANRMLVRRVTAIAASWEGTRQIPADALAKVRVTGNPVRAAVLAAASPYRPVEPGGEIRLAVFGGSQGARFFSECVPPALARLAPALRGRLRVVQQCREEDLAEVRAAYAASAVAAELAPFFKDLPVRLAAAHLVIARSGASSVSELAVLGRPAVLVPLPHSLDNDQLHNAMRLADAGGAWCIEQKDLTPERLAGELARLLESADQLAVAAERARGQGKPGAVGLLADLVEDMGGKG